MQAEMSGQRLEVLFGASRIPHDHAGHRPRAELLGILDDQLAGQVIAREAIIEPVTTPDLLDSDQRPRRKLLDLGDHRPRVEGDRLDDLLWRVPHNHRALGTDGRSGWQTELLEHCSRAVPGPTSRQHHRYPGLDDETNCFGNRMRQQAVAIHDSAINVQRDQAWAPALTS